MSLASSAAVRAWLQVFAHQTGMLSLSSSGGRIHVHPHPGSFTAVALAIAITPWFAKLNSLPDDGLLASFTSALGLRTEGFAPLKHSSGFNLLTPELPESGQ